MDIAWYLYPLIILAGIVAGFINTLAGNGSAITLSLLVFLGLSPTMANGTNRVGVIVQSIIGYQTFKRNGMVHKEGVWWLIVPAVLGAIIGALIAVDLDEATMNLALGILMIVLLGLVLVNPKKWLADQMVDPSKIKSPATIAAMFLVGMHGGFIQAGVGVLLLTTLVLGAGYSLSKANGVKLLIVIFFTTPALLLFLYHGQVNWFFAILLTVGQSIGAWIGATYASKYENANIWVRRLLIGVILIAIVKFLGLYKLIW